MYRKIRAERYHAWLRKRWERKAQENRSKKGAGHGKETSGGSKPPQGA